MSDSLQPHGLKHTRLPCPSPSSRAYSTHVHQVGGGPSHLLSSASPTAFNLSQHQGLFQWVSSSHQVAKVLELQLQQQCFQWIFRIDFLYDLLVWSPCSPRDSQESSPTPQFKSFTYVTARSCNWVFRIMLTSRWFVIQSTNSDSTVRKSPAPRNSKVALVFPTELCLLSPKFWGCNSDPGLAILTL